MRESERRRAVRFPARLILGTPTHCLAFGFGSGLAPIAPGTFGTLPGVLLFLLLFWLPWEAFAAVTAVLFLFGIWLCGRSSERLGVHDHPGIVWDEIVGYLVAAFPLLPALAWVDGPLWLGLLVAFASFRFFDAVKPPPIRALDAKVEGGFGIMLDDLVAGVMAAASTWLLMLLLAATPWQ